MVQGISCFYINVIKKSKAVTLRRTFYITGYKVAAHSYRLHKRIWKRCNSNCIKSSKRNNKSAVKKYIPAENGALEEADNEEILENIHSN